MHLIGFQLRAVKRG